MLHLLFALSSWMGTLCSWECQTQALTSPQTIRLVLVCEWVCDPYSRFISLWNDLLPFPVLSCSEIELISLAICYKCRVKFCVFQSIISFDTHDMRWYDVWGFDKLHRHSIITVFRILAIQECHSDSFVFREGLEDEIHPWGREDICSGSFNWDLNLFSHETSAHKMNKLKFSHFYTWKKSTDNSYIDTTIPEEQWAWLEMHISDLLNCSNEPMWKMFS